MARPKKEINPEIVEKLAALQCTLTEMAAFCGCDPKTLTSRFPEEIAKGREQGKISIRRAQIRILEKGNATMAIWLGKQYLGQREPKLDEGDGNHLALERISNFIQGIREENDNKDGKKNDAES